MSTSRREFLRTAAAAGAAAALGPVGLGRAARSAPPPDDGGRKLRILMLGGTGFLGPIIVNHALARGHEVTLFNRGQRDEMFPDLEQLRGDRYEENALDPLKGRTWDVAIDTWTYLPHIVRRSAEALRDSVSNYIVVSTISVYGDRGTIDMDEDAPLATMPAETADSIRHNRDIGAHYGALKALCEQTVAEVMGGRSCNIRPGLIVGPRDSSDRWTWWPWRIRKGGEVIGPGSPDHYTQIIDVRDCGEFCVTAAEASLRGSYNCITPARMLTMGAMLDDCRAECGSDARFTWIDDEFLTSHGVTPWGHLPAWIPPRGNYAGFGQMSTERAVKAGLTFRTIRDTARATLDWLDTLPPERIERIAAGLVRGRGGAGVPPELEASVLKAWREGRG